MNSIQFLCGCSVPLKEKEIIIDEDTVQSVRYIDGKVKKDALGMLICGEHGFRRKAFNSLPVVKLKNDSGDDEIETDRPDFSYAGKSIVEIEAQFLQTNRIMVT